MSDILAKLYNGEIFPAEQVISKNSNYRKVCRQEDDFEEKLKSQLNDKQNELYQSMYSERLEKECIWKICSSLQMLLVWERV